MSVLNYGQTYNYNIYHQRNRNFGGKFDGSAYVNSNYTPTASTDVFYQKIRFKLDNLDSTYGLFGALDIGSDAWAVLVNTSGQIVLKTGTTPTITTFTDYSLSPGIIYNLWVSFDDTRSAGFIIIMDKYMNVLFTDSDTIATMSYPTVAAYIGAISNDEDAENMLEGYIYDVEFQQEKTVGTVNDTINGKRRYVFKKNYDGVGDSEVACFYYSANNGDIYDAPTDFWGSETEISDIILTEDLQEIYTNTDYYGTTNFKTWGFSYVDGEYTFEVDDTILIKKMSTDVVSPVYQITAAFRIVKINEANQGIVKVEVEDVWAELSRIYVSKFFTNQTTDANRLMWWSNFIPIYYGSDDYMSTDYADLEFRYDSGGSNADSWFTALAILKRMYYVLGLDYVFDDVVEPTTDTETRLDFAPYRIVFLIEDLIDINNENDTSWVQRETKNNFSYTVGNFYLKLCGMLGIQKKDELRYVGGSSVDFRLIELISDMTFSDNYTNIPIEDPETIDNKVFHKVTANYGGSSYTWFDEDYTDTADSAKTLSFPKNMYPKQRTLASFASVTFTDWGEYIAKNLDSEFRGELVTQVVETPEYAQGYDEKIISKSQNLVSRMVKVKVYK